VKRISTHIFASATAQATAQATTAAMAKAITTFAATIATTAAMTKAKAIAMVAATAATAVTKATAMAALALLVGLFSVGCVVDGPDDTIHLPLGAAMPDFRVEGPNNGGPDGDDPNGEGQNNVVSKADLIGKRSLILFFRSTCPDCRRELPKIQAAWEALGARQDISQEIEFVVISKESDADVSKYWAEKGYTMPRYRDATGAATRAFGVRYVPTLYLFDSDGKVAFAAVETFGFDSNALIEKIEALQ
jgi:peroxiredoxin